MKANSLLCVLFLSACSALAQTNSVTAEKVTVDADKKAALSLTPGVAPAQPDKPVRKVQATGLLVDIVHTNHPLRLFDLRTPVDPAKDAANVGTNLVSGRAAGFRLLSIRF